jgi:uncharacterized protein
MTDFGLSEHTIKILKDYFNTIDDIEMVKIYGSRALGTFRKGSDIDFAIFGGINPDLISKISYELDELQTPYMFDVTDYNSIQNPDLKEHVDKFGKNFYLRENK